MNYLFYGLDRARIQKEIDKVIQECGSDCDVIRYDLYQNDMSEVLQEVSTLPFFSANKVVIVHHCDFLSSKSVEFDSKLFEDYLNHPILENILILTGEFEKCDSRKKIVKLVQKTCRTKVFNLYNDQELRTYIMDKCRQLHLDLPRHLMEVLLSLMPNDIAMVDHHLEKLVCYPNEIDEEVLKALIPRSLDENIFLLSESILKGNFKQAYHLYKDMSELNYSPIHLLAVTSSQMRFAYQVKVCSMQGMGEESCASYLKAHSYRVKLTMKMVRNIDLDRLSFLIDTCFQYEYDMKTGKVDHNLGFELFLLKCKEGLL